MTTKKLKTITKIFCKKTIITFIALITILSISGFPYLTPNKVAQASSGYAIDYKNDGGATPDTFLNDANTAEAIAKIEAFESLGTNTITSVTLEILEAMGPNNVSTGFTRDDISQVALYIDTNGNDTFDSGTDTALATSVPTSSWTQLSSPTRWRYTFSGLSVVLPTTYSSTNTSRIFVVAKPVAASLNATPMKGFQLQVPLNAVVVTNSASQSTLRSFPTDYPRFLPPVWIGTEGSGNMGTQLLISEIGTGVTDHTDYDFVELYNRGDQVIDLNGFRLVKRAASDTVDTILKAWSAQALVQPHSFYLYSTTAYNGHGVTADAHSTTGLASNEGVALRYGPENTGAILDSVTWGTVDQTHAFTEGMSASNPPTNGSLERKAWPDSTVAKIITGGIHATQGNGEDTNFNAGDFILRDASDEAHYANPQNTSSTIETSGGGYNENVSAVLINEILYNTTAGTGWIEIYNRSTSAIDFSGWKVISNTKTYTAPASTSLAAGSYVKLNWNATGTDTSLNLYTSNSNGTTVDANLGTFGGDVLLKNSANAIKDYVQYGGPSFGSESAASAAAQWTTGDYVANCLYNQSLGRRAMTGDDFNNSGDWQCYSSTSAGNPNMGGDSAAPDKVTNVTLADGDTTTNSGLDGRDITITWTPATTVDPTFSKYELYILPATTYLDTATHIPVDQIYGGQYQYVAGVQQTTSTYTGAAFIQKDSANTSLGTGSYKAYIIAVDFANNKSAVAMSAAANLTAEAYDAGNDTQKPFIMHMGVGQAKEGVNIVLIARFDDDRQLGAVPGVGAQVVYKVNAGAWTTVNCSALESKYHSCTIPSAAAVTGNTISYYLKSQDAATTPNTGYMSASPINDMTSGVTETTIRTAPFIITVVAAAAYTDAGTAVDLSGNIYKSNGGVFPDDQQPKIFLEGTGIGLATVTNGTGAFSFADDTIPSGSYNMVAFKDGYMDMFRNVFKGDTSINVYLNQGEMKMNVGTAGSAYMEFPFVSWTAPGDGSMGAPSDIYCTSDCSTLGAGETPIVIAFSKEMNSNTINDQDASDTGSNIYLTPDGGNTRVAGKVKYVYTSGTNEARFYAATHNSLQKGKFYNIVVTQNVKDKNGNSIPGGAMADGSFSNGFSTMVDMSTYMTTGGISSVATGYGQGGMMMPPYVKGITPQPGAFNVNRNISIVIEFSEPMNSTSITTSTIKVYPIANQSSWTVGTAVSGTVSLDLATQKISTFTPTTQLDLNASNGGWYVVRVMGAVKSSKGVWLGNPQNCSNDPDTCLLTMTSYESNFQLNSTAGGDTTPPTVLGTYPVNNDGISNNNSVIVGIASIDIGFSEPMLPSTINAQNITMKAGSTSVTGKVDYEAVGNNAKFVPSAALLASTQYTVTVGTGVKDLANNAITTAYIFSFKTGSADTVAPELIYANADDYTLAITFSEPMNAAKQTDTTRWGASVLNPANYQIKTLSSTGSGTSPYGSVTTLDGISNLSFSYDDPTNTVMIEGFMLFVSEPHPTDLRVFASNVKDKSNNLIANSGNSTDIGTNYKNATQCPIQSSANTYGMLGPGGGGMMMMGTGGGGPVTSSVGGVGGGTMTTTVAGPSMNMGTMGMKKGGAFPMNMMAGQTASYFVDIPLTKQIQSGGQIILTFPTGFNVASAAKDSNAPVNSDINEWATGTITIADVTPSQTSRTITVTTGGGDTLANDFLHMQIKGIVNSSVPKEFGTDGYTVDIKTKSPAGVLLETVETMPFYITQAGTNTITGTVTAASATTGTMSVYLGSPMTGPMEKELNFATLGNGTATYTFSNLPNGDYHLFTDSFITLGANSYLGNTMPEPTWVSGGSTSTKNITLESAGAGAGKYDLTIHLVGNFTTSGSNDNVDIFASSGAGFRAKTVTPGNTTGADYHLYLPDGDWMLGVGPAVPKGPMAGPVKMPDWIPPMPTSVKISGAGTVSSVGATLTINLGTQSVITVTGSVVDDTGSGIADAEVYAFQPQGGFGGAHTQSTATGTFTLKIPIAGIYKIGAHKPGLPAGNEISLDVQANVSGVSLKLKKPAYTISGKVLNASSQAVAYAPVWAYQQSSSGHANTSTDSTGNYILYVDNGTWTVEADAPGTGWLQYDLPITINSASQSNINLKPATGTSWYTIGGTITIGGTAQTNMPVRAVEYDVNGNYLGKEYGGITNSSGVYSISVKGTGSATTYKYYRVDSWTNNYGEVELTTDGVANSPANIKVSNANITGADITIGAGSLKTTTIQFDNKAGYSSREAFVKIEGVTYSGAISKPTGFRKSVQVANISGSDPTISLAAGDYFFFVDVPGTGNYIPKATSPAFDSTKKCITIDGTNDTVQFALPDLSSAAVAVSISGKVYHTAATAGNELGSAWVWIGNPTNGFQTGVQTAANGTYTLTVPVGSSYKMGADKPGYMSGQPVDAVLTDADANGAADTAQNFVLTTQSQTISGTIYADANSNSTYDSGEAIANGWIRAEESTTKAKAFSPVDAAGAYSLGVSNGTWKVYGMADGYLETQYSEGGLGVSITVSGSSVSGKNIKMNADSAWTSKTKSKPVTPASGGTVDDTGQNTTTGKASGTGVKITLPPNALGSSTSSGNISAKETSAVADTSSMKPFAGKAKEITATDSSGQPITTLNDYVDLEMVLYKADVVANTEMTDYNQLKTIQVGYWDDTLNNWVNLPTTRTAYYKNTGDTDWTAYVGTATQSGFDKFVDDALVNATFTAYSDYMLVFKASTNHFSIFALGISPDGLAPAAPTGLAQSTGTGSAITITWSAVGYNSDGSVITDLVGYEVYHSTDGTNYSQLTTSTIAAGTQTYTHSSLSGWTSHYYEVTAKDDDGGESLASSALRACSNKSVTNGTVANTCTITCNSGYTLNTSSHTCDVSGGGVVTGGGGGSSGQQTTTTTTTEAKTTETTTTEKPIAQMNTTELRAKIAQIQAQIQVLLGELAKLGVSATTVAKVQFKATLKTGQTSDEVKAMQQCLAKDKDVYPQGIASGYFGSLTKQALIKFQEKYGTEILAPYGLTKGTGIVGSATRQKLNEICK